MNTLPSVQHFADHGRVKAACGHKVDVRKLVFVHYPHGVKACCPDCAHRLSPWDGK
jgi:hypothetical protein